MLYSSFLMGHKCYRKESALHAVPKINNKIVNERHSCEIAITRAGVGMKVFGGKDFFLENIA